MMKPHHHKHAIMIASTNRPTVLRETLLSLWSQTVRPGQVVVSVAKPEDVPDDVSRDPRVQVLIAPKGSASQRNYAIDSLQRHIDIVTFLDDDVELESVYLEMVSRFLEDHPEVVVVDGTVLKNGDVERPEAIRS